MSDGFSGDASYEERPWGNFRVVLDEPSVKIKKITVNPKQRLSLQLHTERHEWWKIISGVGEIQKGEQIIEAEVGKEVVIYKYEVHSIANTGETDLVFVEVQTGVCREDDIFRLQDQYGRIEA